MNVKYVVFIILVAIGLVYLGYNIRRWQVKAIIHENPPIDTIDYRTNVIDTDSIDSLINSMKYLPKTLEIKKLDEDELEKRLNFLLTD